MNLILTCLKIVALAFCAQIGAMLLASALVDTSRLYTAYSPFYRYLLRSASAIVLFFCNVHTEISGADKLPEGQYLLLCNHRSAYDPLVTLSALPQARLAFISKPENFEIPVIGRLMRRGCCLPIDRENPRKAMETITAAANLLQIGEQSVVVYPEGTRSTTGELLPFHAGVIKIAQKAHVGVVICTLEGTEQIRKNAPFRRTKVKLSILETLTPEEVQAHRTSELGEKVRETMERQLLHS